MLETFKKRISKILKAGRKRFGKLNRHRLTLVFLVIGLIAFIYYFKSLFVVAIVNGEPITRLSLVKDLEKQSGREALQTLITRTLIMQEAHKNGIQISNTQVDSRIKEVEDQVASQGGNLEQLLALQGQTREDLRDQARLQITIEALLQQNITITDQEIEEYFNQNKDTYPKETKLEDVKETIRENLRQQKLLQQFQSWIEDVQTKAKIIYFKTY